MTSGTQLRAAGRLVTSMLLLALLLLAALPAGAAAQEGQALVRVVHLAAGVSKVDLYVDGTRMVPATPFRSASEYHRVPASAHTLEIRPAGAAAGPASAASARVSVRPGAAYSAVLLGTPGRLQAKVAKDDFSAPPPGKAKLRIVVATPQAPPLDIGIAGGPTLFRNVGFGTVSDFVAVDAGRFSLEVRPAGSSSVLFTQGASTLPAGTIITVAGTITSAGKIEILPILDAAGAGNLPRGGVATGAGGTADRQASGAAGAVGLPVLLGLLVVLALAAGRRERPRRPNRGVGG
jgi:Domain of unknown function (DUF4397)